MVILHHPNALHIGVPTMQATTINIHTLDVFQQGLVMRAYICANSSSPRERKNLTPSIDILHMLTTFFENKNLGEICFHAINNSETQASLQLLFL